MLKLVYICSPLRGDIQSNIKKANTYCAYAAEKGVIPLAPHTIFTQYLDDTKPQQRQKGLEMGMELLKRCDELWVCGDVLSNGMKQEIEYAKGHGITTLYYSESFFHNERVSHTENYSQKMKQKILEIQENYGQIFVTKEAGGKITSVIFPKEIHGAMNQDEIKEVKHYIASAGSPKPAAEPVEDHTLEMQQ